MNVNGTNNTPRR